MSAVSKFFIDTLPGSSDPALLLDKAVAKGGLLAMSLPLLKDTVGFEQNRHHGEDLWTHLRSCYVNAIHYTNDAVFSLGALLHDIGKVQTRVWDEGKGDYTFHLHEVRPLGLIDRWMTREGFNYYSVQRVRTMIESHLFRFYPESKDSTIRKWLRAVERQGWEDLRILRIVDRMSNAANRHKPVITREYQELEGRIEGLLTSGKPIFADDLALSRSEIRNILVDKNKVEAAISDCLSLCYDNQSKNTRSELEEYLIRVYN